MAGLPVLALPGLTREEGLWHQQAAAFGAVAALWVALIAAMAGCAVPTHSGPPAGTTIPSSAGADSDDVVFAPYAAASAAGRRVLRFDPAASSLRAYVFRAGRAARLGHNHVLSAVDFSGACLLAAGDLAGSRCDIVLHLDRLEIDRAELRAALGSAFAATLSPEAIAATRAHMLGEDNLQAARFPTLRLRTLALVGELPKPMAQIEVTLHGQRRAQWLALDVRGLPQRLQVRGAFVLRQSDFGIVPYAVGNGLIAVQDEIAVEFELVGD